jgi:hypothetical protein
MLLPPPHPQIGRFDPLSRLGPATPRRSPAELFAAHEGFRQHMRKLAPDDQLAAARAAIETARKDWTVAAREAARDGKRWDLARAGARRSLQERLGEAVPSFAKIRKLQRAHLDALLDKARPKWPELEPVVVPEEPPPTVFRVPFGLEMLGSLSPFEGLVDTMDIVDRSFVRREIGHLIVDADLAADPGAVFGFNEWFGILPLDLGCVSAACGSAYALPQDGRLLVTASLRNFYSKVTLSLHDEWGFSSGTLGVDATMFIAVLRPNGGVILHSLLAERTLTSDGDDVSKTLPDIEQGAFNLVAATDNSFEAGETVFVLAGVSVSASSALNDMEARVRALLWWSLEQLTVQVVTDIIT